MQKISTAMLGSWVCGVKFSQPLRWPSWKIQTIAPKAAPSDTRFITTALRGSSSEPTSRKSTTYVTSTTNTAAAGVRDAIHATSSWVKAVDPPTSLLPPGGPASFRMAATSDFAWPLLGRYALWTSSSTMLLPTLDCRRVGDAEAPAGSSTDSTPGMPVMRAASWSAYAARDAESGSPEE